MKKALKYILRTIVIFIIILGIAIAYFMIRYNDEVPKGISGLAADNLAMKMESALNKKAYDSTSFLAWSFRNNHHYRWFKSSGKCEVRWKNYRVDLDLSKHHYSKAFNNDVPMTGEEANQCIKKALDYFNNDSFWLAAPYKTFDEGVERYLVKTEAGAHALLVTYTSGGSTPGDSYLWLLQDNGKPYAFKMWTSILPLKGLEASWNDWIETKSGALLPQSHQLLFSTIDMGEVTGLK